MRPPVTRVTSLITRVTPSLTPHQSVKASLRDPESLKEAFTDFGQQVQRTRLALTNLTTHER
ncbi:hypothetical protein AVR91_0240350 [Amycolatopsis keratiniphila subsp. keratiniphila]|uniref:Uncharacterized protein n=1 Tax=Amycolatopsis keratiniphila subsp. keratiniphila TaxID=227715 RepID=A0A1W2LGT9_9PSEU|nr:hypothetical protein AVR91_0240350 [Amycolatopsis keratiniphila subsp. keratiniphila]